MLAPLRWPELEGGLLSAVTRPTSWVGSSRYHRDHSVQILKRLERELGPDRCIARGELVTPVERIIRRRLPVWWVDTRLGRVLIAAAELRRITEPSEA